MGILLGLSSALFWGSADLFAGKAARRIGAYLTLFLSQFVSFIAISVYLLFSGGFAQAQSVTPTAWGAAILTALVNICAAFCLYRAFEVGTLAVVSPIVASYGALAAVLAFFSGERLDAIHVFGVVAAVLGVMLTAAAFSPAHVDRRALTRGVGWAIGAAVAFAFDFWLLGFHVVPAMGGVLPVWVFRTVSIVVLGVGLRLMRQPLRPPTREIGGWMIVVGLLDTGAFLASNFGVLTEQVTVVTVLSSLYSAVTVVLAYFFLSERLHRSQWVGVTLILGGIVLVSV